MADVKVLAEELVNLTVKDVQELAKILKEEYGIEPAAAAVAVAAPAAAAEAAAAALKAQKEIVLANAAFAIQVLEKGQKSIEECIEIARESIDSGKALATFKKFVEFNS